MTNPTWVNACRHTVSRFFALDNPKPPFDNASHTSSILSSPQGESAGPARDRTAPASNGRQGTMTSQAGGSRIRSTLQDRLNEVLHRPGPLDKRALLATLDAEVTARELHAYKAGWNDAVAELRRRS